MSKKRKVIPRFKSEATERKFRETHEAPNMWTGPKRSE
jgi:hypothetical protein